VTDESEALRIAEFEHVAADSSVTLLRVSGTLAPTPQASAQRPTLIAEHGGGRQRFPALPSPPDPPGGLRAAYSVPAAVDAPATSYTLELDDGSWVPLPTPTLGAARRPAAPAAVRSPEATSRERAAWLESENERLSATLAELEVWRGELERRLAHTTDQLAEARSRLLAAEMEALSTRAEAAATAQAARELAEAMAADRPPR